MEDWVKRLDDRMNHLDRNQASMASNLKNLERNTEKIAGALEKLVGVEADARHLHRRIDQVEKMVQECLAHGCPSNQAIRERLGKLESDRARVAWLIVTAVLLSVLGIVLGS